jgi:hypothetical protein
VIVFDLGCENHHRFEGWFASRDEFDRQLQGKLLRCPICDSGRVKRVPHAARINRGAREEPRPETQPAAEQQYTNLGPELLGKLIARIVETTEDVGAAFPEEARKIHYREIPERHIRGTATPKDVEALTEEGIEVAALPVPSHLLRKAH